jgi:hypothetical protein
MQKSNKEVSGVDIFINENEKSCFLPQLREILSVQSDSIIYKLRFLKKLFLESIDITPQNATNYFCKTGSEKVSSTESRYPTKVEIQKQKRKSRLCHYAESLGTKRNNG